MNWDSARSARLYCAIASAALIAYGLGAWTEGRGNNYSGALACGGGLFIFTGLFAHTQRLTALLGLCICFFGAAFCITSGLQLWNEQWPSGKMIVIWAAELIGCALAWPIARRLYLASL